MTTLDLDAVTELERSQNSYIAKMSGGHNSIIVRSKDDELAECYRLMGAAAARLRQLTDENDRWQEEARQYAENADYWRDRLNDHKASLAIQAFTAPDEDEAVMMESLVARIGDLLAERDEYRRQLDTLRNAIEKLIPWAESYRMHHVVMALRELLALAAVGDPEEGR